MKKKKLLFMGFAVLLVLSVFFATCDDPTVGEPEQNSQSSNITYNVFTRHPTSANYVMGSTVKPLIFDVLDSMKAEGTWTYQWYSVSSFTNKGGTVIENEKGNISTGVNNVAFSPDISETGTKYYYVVVSKTIPSEDEGEDDTVETLSIPSNPAQIAVLGVLPDAPTNHITVGTEQYQYIRGFGGMSNAFGIGSPARYMELRDIETMFNQETGLGFNLLRICLFPYPLEQILRGQHYPGMGNQQYVKIVETVNKHGGYVLASPWSPPPEYKTNQSLYGDGRLKPTMFRDYAEYLRAFAAEMAERGAPVYAVAIQNEPTHTASYDGMLWNQDEHLNFAQNFAQYFHQQPYVAGYGGGKAQSRVLLMGGEPHNDIAWNASIINNATARNNIDIIAYHTYGSLNSRWAPARNNQKEIWMTEKNHNSGDGNFHLDSTWNYVWVVANEVYHSLVNVDNSGFVWWYAKRFYSFIGDGSNGTQNGSILPRGYVMSH